MPKRNLIWISLIETIKGVVIGVSGGLIFFLASSVINFFEFIFYMIITILLSWLLVNSANKKLYRIKTKSRLSPRVKWVLAIIVFIIIADFAIQTIQNRELVSCWKDRIRIADEINPLLVHQQYLGNLTPTFIPWSIKKGQTQPDGTNSIIIFNVDGFDYLRFGHSMYPSILIGNTLLVKNYTKSPKLQKGMIVGFQYNSSTLFYHRITSINANGTYTTQGDFNLATEDVNESQIKFIVMGVLYTSPDYIPGYFEGYKKN